MRSSIRAALAAKVGILSRHHGIDHQDVIDARRDLREAQGRDFIAGLLVGEPELTAEQRRRLAALLLPDGAS